MCLVSLLESRNHQKLSHEACIAWIQSWTGWESLQWSWPHNLFLGSTLLMDNWSPLEESPYVFLTHTHTHTHTNFLSVYVRDLRSVEDGPPPRAKRNLFSNSFLDHTWILKLCQVPSLLGSSFSPPRPHPTHIDPPNWPFGVSGQVFPSAHQFTFTSISHKGFYCTRKWIYPPWDQGSKVAPMQRASPLVVKFGNL